MNNDLEFQRWRAQKRGATAMRDDWMFPVERALDSIEGFDEWFVVTPPRNMAHMAFSARSAWDAFYKARGYDMYGQALPLSPADQAIVDEGAQPRRYCSACGAWNYMYPQPCPVCNVKWDTEVKREQAQNERVETHCVLCGAKSRTFECQECSSKREHGRG